MSRFLKSKKRIALLYICLCGTLMLFTDFWILSILLYLGAILILVNHWVVKKNGMPYSVLHANREIKQYANLVIGDFVSPSSYLPYLKEGHTLIITSPRRSFAASYQILLHVVSCMEDKGNCIIVPDDQAQGYSLFDVLYFNLITRKELDVEYLMERRRFPFIYEPIKSLRILFNIHSKQYKESECPSMELLEFCRRKGITLTFLSHIDY